MEALYWHNVPVDDDGADDDCRRCFREERWEQRQEQEQEQDGSGETSASCAACFSARHIYGHYLDLVASAPRPVVLNEL